jgi:hypothetical protein
MLSESREFHLISLALVWVTVCRLVQASSPFLSGVFWALTCLLIACRLVYLARHITHPREISVHQFHIKTV